MPKVPKVIKEKTEDRRQNKEERAEDGCRTRSEGETRCFS
jgi:hypothetical protein